MGKSSKYPSYSTGSVEINGKQVASTTKKNGNTISSSYNMNNTEKSIYDGIQNNLSSSLSSLFDISDSTKQQWQNQLDAYQRQGIKQIDNIYTPMQNALKNDIANRFGNLDNSIFMDNLNKITENKAEAVANLSDSLLMQQDQLYANEMTNRMNYVSLLSNLNTTFNNQMLSYMGLANQNSASGNQYNQMAYQAALQRQQSLGNSISSIGNAAGTALTAVNPALGMAVKVGSNIAGQYVANS